MALCTKIFAGNAKLIGHLDFPNGAPIDLVVFNGYVYVINSWSRGHGILAFDTTNPSKPKFLGGTPAMGYPLGCTLSKGYLYVPTCFSLLVIDVRKPGDFKLVRNILFDFSGKSQMARVVSISGNLLYLGGKTGLRVMNISDPGSPVLSGCYPKIGYIKKIASQGDFVYLAVKGKLQVTRFEKESLEVLNTLKIKRIKQMLISNKTLFVLSFDNLLLYDISDPENPVLRKKIPKIKRIGSIQNNRMYLKVADNKIEVMDISNTFEPKRLREIELPKNISLNKFDVEKNLLYVLDSSKYYKVNIFDISSEKPQMASELPIVRGEGMIDIKGDSMILSYGRKGKTRLLTLNFNNPNQLPSSHYLEGAKSHFFVGGDVMHACAIKRHGNFLLVGDGLVDISDPLQPITLKNADYPAATIKIKGQYAYLAQGDRVSIEDISKLPEIQTVGIYKPKQKKTTINDIAIGVGVAYVINGSKLEVIDISNPTRPKQVTSCKVPPSTGGVLKGSYLYLLCDRMNNPQKVLSIIDVSNPIKPIVVKTVKGIVESGGTRIIAKGSRLYFVDGTRGIKELDISDPLNPKLIAKYMGKDNLSKLYTDIFIIDDILYGRRYSSVDKWKIKK